MMLPYHPSGGTIAPAGAFAAKSRSVLQIQTRSRGGKPAAPGSRLSQGTGTQVAWIPPARWAQRTGDEQWMPPSTEQPIPVEGSRQRRQFPGRRFTIGCPAPLRLQSANPRLSLPASNSSQRSARRWIAAGLDNSPSCQARHSSTRLRNSLWQRMPTSVLSRFVRGRARF